MESFKETRQAGRDGDYNISISVSGNGGFRKTSVWYGMGIIVLCGPDTQPAGYEGTGRHLGGSFPFLFFPFPSFFSPSSFIHSFIHSFLHPRQTGQDRRRRKTKKHTHIYIYSTISLLPLLHSFILILIESKKGKKRARGGGRKKEKGYKGRASSLS